jgi:xylulokinase
VLGMLCGLADALDAMRDKGIEARRILLIGGASKSKAVRALAADIFGAPVAVPAEAEYVALGAARQAAWVLSGEAAPPQWDHGIVAECEPSGEEWGQLVRARYAEVRRSAYGV